MQTEALFKQFCKYGFLTPRILRFSPDSTPQIDFYPVALKIDSPKVIHKSDVGGVILNLYDEASLEKAKAKITTSLLQAAITLDNKVDAFIAVEMIEGEEFYIGMAEDPVFGKTIVFGKGGTLLELYHDICYIDTDADEEEILKSLQQTKAVKFFEGLRGSIHTVSEVLLLITKFQNFIKAHPHITEIDLNPLILTEKGFVIVDARVKYSPLTTRQNDCRPPRHNFFNNTSIALIGASHNRDKVGYALAKNLLEFEDSYYFVTKKGGTLFGKKCHEDTSSLDRIDTAIIAIPPVSVYDEICKLIPKGLRNVIIISAGFKESGNTVEEERIAQLLHLHRLNVIGPNCLGYANTATKLNATFANKAPMAGNIALLAQSGAVLTALMDKANDEGIGFSHIISFGNMVDFDFSDAIIALQDEPTCETICIYTEGIIDGKALLKAIRSSSKPIIFFKTGRTSLSQKAAFSHTGNLCGNYAIGTGLLRSAGAHQVTSIEGLLYTPRFIDVKNILILTNAGGPGTILTDLIVGKNKTLYPLSPHDIEALNSVLPSNWSRNNPIDIIGDATSKRFAAALEVIESFNAELIFVIITPQFMTDDEEIAKVLQTVKKPVITVWLGGNSLQKGRAYCKKYSMLSFESLEESANVLAD